MSVAGIACALAPVIAIAFGQLRVKPLSALLGDSSTGLSASCGPIEESMLVYCSDYNGTFHSFYFPTAGDPALQVHINLTYTAIPEPSAALIMAVGLLVAASSRRPRS